MLSELLNKVRRNHGLEHATVAILLEKGVRPPMGGYSVPGGFFIFGRIPTELVGEAVHEAFDRMSSGQRELAISPYCGTNLATGAMLAGLVARIVMGRKKEGRLKRLPLAILAALSATLLGRPLGNALQKRYTTMADVEVMEVSGIVRLGPVLHRISTRNL